MAERREAISVLVLAILLATGCRGTPQPVVRAGEAADQPAKPAAATPPATPEATPKPAAEPGRDDTPVVVDPGVDDGAEVSLVEAARAERKRRAHAGEPVAVINDKTLPQYAAKGQITIADPKPKKPAAEAATGVGKDGEPLRDEQYWRGRALEIRQRWRRAADDVEELEQKATELRQKFYLENDTFARDNRIKPEWDRVLDKLSRARLEVEEAKKELADLQEEGGAAGAMPGWLREGEEEEPEPKPGPRKKEGLPPAQSIEPPVLEPPPADGRGELR